MQGFIDQLQKAGIENPWRELRLLLSHVTGKSYEHILFEGDCELSAPEYDTLSKALQRRCNHEPLSKIIGQREFWGLPFKVTKDTLDPRPDSETLIEAVLKDFPDQTKPLRFLDFGTGTGCLLLSLLSEYPNAFGVGVDKSEAAILVALENARVLEFSDRASFLISDWGQALKGTFDCVISNPPYIGLDDSLERNVKDFDPHSALYAGKDGLDAYRALFSEIGSFCHSQTKIFMEIGQGQKESAAAIAKENGFNLSAVHKDLSGTDRVLGFTLYAW